jgi:carboxylesterase type B
VNSSLPVKVWIYGGAFYAGSTYDPMYNGCGIATNAIVVTMNYRLGPLGWLTLDSSLNLTGNYGVLDVLMALQWVQDNITSFGGNKVRIDHEKSAVAIIFTIHFTIFKWSIIVLKKPLYLTADLRI